VHEDFLFKARSWDMDSAPSICPGCSNGCNIDIAVKENQIVRVKPRYNADVNGFWMCDHGRKNLVMANRGSRIDLPLIRRNGELEAVHWGEALEWLAANLPDGVAGHAVISAFDATESLAAVRALLEKLGIEGGVYRMSRGHEAALGGFPQLKLRAERAPNAAGAELFGFRESDGLPEVSDGQTLVVVGDRLADAPAEYGAGAGFFLYIGSHLSDAVRHATAILPATTFAEMEGTFVNHEGRVQRFHQSLVPPGVARPTWMILRRLLNLGSEVEGPLVARDAFAAAAAESGKLAGLSWDEVGLKGVNPGGATAPAAK
jgi:NADH-quinone oxidoreductase subunit G